MAGAGERGKALRGGVIVLKQAWPMPMGGVEERLA